MISSNKSLFMLAAVIAFAAGLASPVAANVPLAEKPLYLGESVKPAFIMAVDDSGSMQWDVLSPNQDGELVWGRDNATSAWGFFRNNGSFRPPGGGVDRTEDWIQVFPFEGRGTPRNTLPPFPSFGFARSPEFNPGYFDPGAEYLPWQNFDGTSYPSMNSEAQWQSMGLDPRSASAVRYNLTQTIRDRSNDAAGGLVQIVDGAPLYAGFVLKAGWSIRSEANSTRTCPVPGPDLTVPANSVAPLVLTQDYVLDGGCTGGSGGSQNEVDVWIPNLVDTPAVGGNAELFNVRPGMVIPAGTEYFVRQRCGGTTSTTGIGLTAAQLGVWTTTASAVTLPDFFLPTDAAPGNRAVNYCDQNGGTTGGPGNTDRHRDTGAGGQDFTVGFSYFAPTYYLTTNTSPDGNTAPTEFNGLAGGPTALTTPGNGRLYRYEIRPANYASTAAYNAAMTNFANWFLYYRTRNLAMVAALTRSMNEVDFMRIGYFQINATNNGTDFTGAVPPVVMHEMSDFTNSTAVAGRRSLYQLMTNLPAAGSTPNGWAVNQLGLQFSRTTGTATPVSEPPIISACQFNAAMLFTDGYSNQGRPTTFGNVDNVAPFATAPFSDAHSDSMGDIAAHYYNTNPRPDLTVGVVPVVPACASANPDPRLDCNRNLHVNFYGITLGASGFEFGVNYQQDPISLAISPDIFVAGNAPPWRAWANDSRNAVDDIWHATVNSRGQFINATSPESISRAMNAIIQSINNAARRSAGTAASGARRSVGFTAYVPEFDPNSWTGDVKAYRLQDDGQLGAVTWSASDRLQAPAARKILVSLPNSAGTAFELQPFSAANLGATDTLRLARLGLLPTDIATGGAYAGRTVEDIVNYLRGDPQFEGTSPGRFRSRLLRNPDGTTEHRAIGDILGSQPEVLDRGTEGFSFLPVANGGRAQSDGTLVPASQTGTYSNFFATTKQTRKPVLIVGANDGMIHGFDARTDNSSLAGTEVFAVMPNSVLNKTGRLLNRNYPHTFLVDGSPRIADACIGSAVGSAGCGWRTVAVTPMGTGGKSVVALDVTDPVSSFDATNLLWEFSTLNDPEMGFVINRPRIYIGEDRVWYAAFGNGLNSLSHRARLYIVNLQTGALVRRVDLGTAGSVLDPNGAVAVAAVDGGKLITVAGQREFEELNGLVDTLYVTDFHGRLYKVNATTGAVDYGDAPLYTAQALDTAERADRRQFVTGGIDVVLHPLRGNLVLFGTGRYIANGDQNVAPTPQVQSFYSVWDDPEQVGGFTGRAALQEQAVSGTVLVSGVNRRQITENPVQYTGTGAKRGWFIDLYQAGAGGFRNGERAIGAPRVEGGNVIFTTFQPIGTQCNPGGRNWLYSLNAITGAAGLNVPGCSLCRGIGGTDLNPGGTAAPPTPEPPIVTDPPSQTPIDTDGDGVPDTIPDVNCVPGTPGCRALPADGSPLAGRNCVTRLSVLLPNAGLSPFTQIPCGRQAWRQIQ